MPTRQIKISILRFKKKNILINFKYGVIGKTFKIFFFLVAQYIGFVFKSQ